MDRLILIGVPMLLAVAGVIAFALLCVPDPPQEERLCPFAVLPVPEASPTVQALLRHYASQVVWIDAQVLRCVLLVYPPENPDAEALCKDMAREYEVYTALPLPEAAALMAEKCRQNAQKS